LSIQTEVRVPAAIRSACDGLRLPEPVFGEAKLLSSPAAGWAVQLREWRYPVVADVNTGKLHYDNYGGHRGEQKELHRFLQAYAVRPAVSRLLAESTEPSAAKGSWSLLFTHTGDYVTA
jgi:hypothetical protein